MFSWLRSLWSNKIRIDYEPNTGLILYSGSDSKIIPLDKIPEFFIQDLVFLRTKFKVVLSESASNIRIINKHFTPCVHVDKKQGWLNFNFTYEVGDYKLPSDIFKKKSDYIKVDNTWIKIDHETMNITEKFLLKLGSIVKEEDGFKVCIEKFSSLEEYIKDIGGKRIIGEKYQIFLDGISSFKADESFVLPKEMEENLISQSINLRPYQRAGIHWLSWLIDNYLHGILADDMGLGKTLQTILVLRLKYHQKRHTLIVCPKSVVRFWSREIKKFFPEIKRYEYIGSYRDKDILFSTDPTIFISTYDTVLRDISILKKVPFHFIVLDEATKIKNPMTKRTKAIKALNSVQRIALSGTPIENSPIDLWSLFDFLMKGYLGNYNQFKQSFNDPIMRREDKEKAQALSRKIRFFVLRRLKKDVAKDLPDKIEIKEWCELTKEQRSLYGQIQERYIPSISNSLKKEKNINYVSCILPVIIKLKQVCNHPAIVNGVMEPINKRSGKFDSILLKIKKIYENREQVVLFSHFLETLNLLEIALEEENIIYVRIDGSTNNRHNYIDKFNKDGVTVLLCSINACSYGINLVAANHVIHVDQWWNPAVEDQATDRVHRIGQDKIVYVHRVLTMDTIEEKIADLLEKKRKISNSIITSIPDMKWTREELLELLSYV